MEDVRMNISKLHKSMLLLVAAATVVAQVGAMDNTDDGLFLRTWRSLTAKPVVVPKGYLQTVWDFTKNAPSNLWEATKAHPYIAGGVAVATVAGLAVAGTVAYKMSRKSDATELSVSTKRKPAKQENKSGLVSKTLKAGAGLGAAGLAVFGGVKAYQNGYFAPIANFVAPYLNRTAAYVAGGVVGTAAVGVPVAKYAFGRKPADQIEDQQPDKPADQDEAPSKDKKNQELIQRIVAGITVANQNVTLGETVLDDLLKLIEAVSAISSEVSEEYRIIRESAAILKDDNAGSREKRGACEKLISGKQLLAAQLK